MDKNREDYNDYWIKNNITKPQQIVVCAANRKDGIIFCGARHCDSVMRAQAEAAGISLVAAEQGFIDQFGEFLTREEAMQIVKDSGQNFDYDRNHGDIVLFSEGLY